MSAEVKREDLERILTSMSERGDAQSRLLCVVDDSVKILVSMLAEKGLIDPAEFERRKQAAAEVLAKKIAADKAAINKKFPFTGS